MRPLYLKSRKPPALNKSRGLRDCYSSFGLGEERIPLLIAALRILLRLLLCLAECRRALAEGHSDRLRAAMTSDLQRDRLTDALRIDRILQRRRAGDLHAVN